MPLDVGGIFAALGAKVDDRGFDQFDRRMAATRRTAARPVEQRLAGDADLAQFERYDRAVVDARRDAVRPVETTLRADPDLAGFTRYDREVAQARRAAGHDVAIDLRADVQHGGFATYDHLVDEARTEALNPIDTRAGLDVDHSSFAGYGAAVRGADGETGRLRASMAGFGGASLAMSTGLGAIGIAGAAGAFGVAKLYGAFEESNKIGKTTEAILKATGHAANLSADDIGDLSARLSEKQGIDDEVIQSSANVLLTFRNVRDEAGRGNDVFSQTTEVLGDLSTVLGTDSSSAAILMGKALNDPIKGTTALGRAGVQFTEQQKEQIKTLVESGRTLDAQKLILREVQGQVGGAAAASATAMDRLKITAGNVAETVGGALAPAVNKGAKAVDGFLKDLTSDRAGSAGAKVRRVVGQVRDELEDLGRSRAVRETGRLIGAGLRAGGDAVERVVRVFRGSRRDFETIGRAIGVVFGVVARAAKAGLRPAVDTIESVAKVVRGVTRTVAAVLRGDFAGAFRAALGTARSVFGAILNVLRTMAAPIVSVADSIANGVGGPLKGIWSGIRRVWTSGLRFILGGVSTGAGAIASLLDAAGRLPVVGNRFKDLADEVRKGQRSIDGYRDSLEESNKAAGRTERLEKLRDKYEALRRRLGTLRRGTDEYRDTAAAMRKTQDRLNDEMGKADAAGRKGARGVRRIGQGAKDAGGDVFGAMSQIAQNVGEVAKGLGGKQPRISLTRAKRSAGSGADAGAAVGGLATGGIPNPGSGSRDDHILVSPSGRAVAALSGTEGVVNTPQMGVIDTALAVSQMLGVTAYGSLGELWGSGMRHYAAGGLMGAKPGLAGYAAAGAKFGLSVSSGRRPGAITSSGNKSQHSTGDALDLSGSPAAMLAFARAFGAQHGTDVDQLIHTPLGYGYSGGKRVPLGFFGPRVNADHFDHVHVGDATPGGGSTSGGGTGGVPTPRLKGDPGALLTIARLAAKFGAKAANDWVDRNQPAADGPVGAGVAQGTDANVVAAFRRAIRTTGAKGRAALALWEAGIVESGLRNLNHGDRDSLGALQLRAGMHGRSLALDPFAAAVAFLRRGFTGKGGAISIAARNAGMSAGNVAQAVQGSAYPGRYDAVAAQARQYLALGGRLARFAGGGSIESAIASARAELRGPGPSRAPGRKGKPGRKLGLRDRLDFQYETGASDLRALRSKQTDRVGDYDAELGGLEDLGKDYGLQERRNDLTEEVLVDEDTGAVNTRQVKRRAAELAALLKIRQRIVARMVKARAIGRRVVKTYGTIIGRLTRARRAAARSRRKKGRKAAVASYDRTLRQYRSNRAEWNTKLKDLGYDLADARLDVQALAGERAEVLGTKATPQEPVDTGSADTGGGDTGTGDTGGGSDTGAGTDSGTGVTDVGTTTAPPSAADIAMAAMQQVATFNAQRADLFGGQGANFAAAGVNPYSGVAGGAAGARFFGGSRGDGGGVGTAAAVGGATAPSGVGAGTTIQQMTVQFAGTTPDLHTAAQTISHELKAA